MAGILFSNQRNNNEQQSAPRQSGGILFQEKRRAEKLVKSSGFRMDKVDEMRNTMQQLASQAEEHQATQRAQREADLAKKKEQMYKVPIAGPIIRGIDRLTDATKPLGQGAASVMGVPMENKVPINSTLDKIMYGAGAIAGGFVNPAALEQSLVTAPYKAAQGIVSRTLPKAGNITQRAATGALSGAATGAMFPLLNTKGDLKDVAEGAAIGGVLGGAGDAAFGAIGSAISRRLKRNGVSDDEVQSILALPMGREDAARMRRSAVETPDVITPDAPTLALPSPTLNAPTTARIAKRANPYREQFEQLIKAAQERQASGGMSPGREDMELEQMWAAMAGREGGSLDELIQRAYPKQPDRLQPGLVQKAKENQSWREVVGAPIPVKSLAERYPQGGVKADAAAPQTVPARAPGVKAEPLNTEPPIKPVQPKPVNGAPKQEEVLRSSEKPIDDVADDIVLPEPEEVAPRIRDRVSSFADDLINNAQAELAKGRNRLSSNPVDVYGHYAKLGAGYMLKGSVKLADFTEQMVKQFGEEIRPHVREIFKRAKVEYQAINKKIEGEELGLDGFDATELKDLSNLNLNTADVYRNFKKVFGHNSPVVKAVLDPFDASKGAYAQEQKNMTDKLYTDIVKGMGINRGSKESALIQQYGEGKITVDELKGKTTKWKQVIKADQWFRQQYNELIDKVNESTKKIYPNRPEKLVPYRKDYYRHFQELSAWSGLKNVFDSSSGRISPSLSGISPYTQPKSKYASFKQKRGLGEYKNDAVGGFLDYIPSASYAIHIDPHISVFRNLAKRLAADTEKTANVNNFIKFLNNYANDLSGKTSPIDRWVEEIGGRNALLALTKANNHIKGNVILGNVRSALSQLANIPAGVAFGGIDARAGAAKTIMSIFSPNEAMAQSRFLKERYLDRSFRRFDQDWWRQPKRFAQAMMEFFDRVGTTFVWNTAHAKGIRQNVADPIKFADEHTRRLIGGRGVGEQPLLIKSKVFNLFAPFQLEVNNQWRVMKDFVDKKQFGSLISLFAANWILNRAFEKTTGNGVVFDPIDAIYDASTEKGGSILTRGGRVLGEVLSNLPFGQTLAAAYPEYGTNIAGYQTPTREEFFGDKDPTRFGSGFLIGRMFSDPLFMFVAPFGGNQVKKSVNGLDALVRGGSYTENVLTSGLKLEDPKLKYPLSAKPLDVVRGALFGPSATSEGQRYNKEDRRPLSVKQTQSYLQSKDPIGYYNKLMTKRELEAEKLKAKEKEGR